MILDEFYAVVNLLPRWIAQLLVEIPVQNADKIHELRFKIGAPPMVTYIGRQMSVQELLPQKIGMKPMQTSSKTILGQALSKSQIEEIFVYLCGGSVHSYEDELGQGFFTLLGGHRVGVGGKYIPSVLHQGEIPYQRQAVWQLQQVTSLNIRIARQKIISLPLEFTNMLKKHFTSIVILGEPDSGKTTVLRSVISLLAKIGRTVVVVDERGELCMQGVDMISGMEKSDAVQLALRTLSPEIIVLDELGALTEVSALQQGFFGGVDFITTLHSNSFAEAEQKPQFQYLQANGMLCMACLLQGRTAPGCFSGVKYYRTIV